MALWMYKGTGLDPDHKNIIDPAKWHDYINAWPHTPVNISASINGEELDIQLNSEDLDKPYSQYDYAFETSRNCFYFVRLTLKDDARGIVFFNLKRDILPDFPAVNFKSATLTQSTSISLSDGGIDIGPIISGQGTPQSVFEGGVWIAAICSDSGTLIRSGEHTIAMVYVEELSQAATYGAMMARLTSAVFTRPGASSSVTISIDGVTGAYVIPEQLVGELPAYVVDASLNTDYPGQTLPITGKIFSTYSDVNNLNPEKGINKSYSYLVSSTNPSKSLAIGNIACMVKLPEIGATSIQFICVISPASGVSVSMTVNGAIYDLTPTLKIGAVYTAEDAQTRNISAVGNLISGAVGAASAIASGGAAHIIASGTQIAGQTVATLASGRAYSIVGGNFPASCTLYDGSTSPLIFAGVALFRFDCKNSVAREMAVKLRGYSGNAFFSNVVLSSVGDRRPGYFRGDGFPVPYSPIFYEMLKSGVTVWPASGVGVL